MVVTLLRTVVVAGWLALLGTRAAAAPTVALGLTRGPGGDGCITAHELALRVEDRLGRGVFVSAAQAELFVDARIERLGRGWHATVSASRANGVAAGRRELDTRSSDCRDLDADLVLVVALVIDPSAPPAAPPPAPPAPAPALVPPPPAPLAPILVPVVVAVETVPRWDLSARVASTLLLARLPAPVPAIELALAATPPRAWPIELGLLASAPARAGDAGSGAAVSLVLGTVALCHALWTTHAWRGHVCAGAALGAMRVRPRGLAPVDASTSFAADVIARLRATAPVIGPVTAVAELGPMVPLLRRHLTYTALDPVALEVVRRDLHAPPVMGWTATLGVGVQFP